VKIGIGCNIQEWPDNKVLLELKNQVALEQIAFVDLVNKLKLCKSFSLVYLLCHKSLYH
jgi:hypothetical protein